MTAELRDLVVLWPEGHRRSSTEEDSLSPYPKLPEAWPSPKVHDGWQREVEKILVTCTQIWGSGRLKIR